MAEIRPKDAGTLSDFREVMEPALRHMVASSMPNPEDVIIEREGESRAFAWRQGSAERLPVVVLRPGFIYGPRDRTLLPRLIEQLLNEGNKKILLNLSDVDYIDSNGLGELVQSLKTSKRFGASLRLLKPQDRVRKTLRLTNLLPMFNLYETEADALKGFATET